MQHSPSAAQGAGPRQEGRSSAKLGYQVLASGSGGQVACVLSPPISSTVDRTKKRREQAQASAYWKWEARYMNI